MISRITLNITHVFWWQDPQQKDKSCSVSHDESTRNVHARNASRWQSWSSCKSTHSVLSTGKNARVTESASVHYVTSRDQLTIKCTVEQYQPEHERAASSTWRRPYSKETALETPLHSPFYRRSSSAPHFSSLFRNTFDPSSLSSSPRAP